MLFSIFIFKNYNNLHFLSALDITASAERTLFRLKMYYIPRFFFSPIKSKTTCLLSSWKDIKHVEKLFYKTLSEQAFCSHFYSNKSEYSHPLNYGDGPLLVALEISFRDFIDHSGKVSFPNPWELYTGNQLKRLRKAWGWGVFLEDGIKGLGLLSRKARANWLHNWFL